MRLGGGDVTVTFELVKEGFSVAAACSGRVSIGTSSSPRVGSGQQGGFGLYTNGVFAVDGNVKRGGLPSHLRGE